DFFSANEKVEFWRVGRDLLFQPIQAFPQTIFTNLRTHARNTAQTWTRVNGFESYAKNALSNPATSNASAGRLPTLRATPSFMFLIPPWPISKPDRSRVFTNSSAWRRVSKSLWRTFCRCLAFARTR